MPDSRKSVGNVISNINFGNTNGIRSEKVVPDYTGDRFHAGILAKRIENFWHSQGHHNVKVWIETDTRSSGTKIHNIRSNIVFNCADLSSVLKEP